MKQLKWKGIFNWGYFFGILAILILVNIISALVNVKFDMTEDRRYSLAQGTSDFLADEKNFENRISIKIYLEGELPAEIQSFRNAIEDKLKDFKTIAGKRIEYQFINPNEGHANKKEEYFFYKGIFDKGILPTTVVYVKNGVQSQLILWPGAEVKSNVQQRWRGCQPSELVQVGRLRQQRHERIETLFRSSLR